MRDREKSTRCKNIYIVSILFLGQQINLPARGDTLYFLKGSTARIEWSYTGITTLTGRLWTFTSIDMRFNKKLLAYIYEKAKPEIETQELDVDVEEPATLVLKNVNSTYNGTYSFEITPGRYFSEVDVFILGKHCWMTTSRHCILL